MLKLIKVETREQEKVLKIAKNCHIKIFKSMNDKERVIIIKVYFKQNVKNADVKIKSKTLN